jgi:hypothetical protein
MNQSILKTLAYFDLFEYPLTSLEVWKYLQAPSPCSLLEVRHGLATLMERGEIEHQRGFWVLPGKGACVLSRLERYVIAERKFGKALHAVRYLRRVGSIRMIAVANTLAWAHARDGSDIDFFIVTRPHALWKSRLAGVSPFALFGLRPRPAEERDMFCFSFFAAETALDLAPLAIEPEDPYLLYWIATLVPVYDPDGLLEAVWDANPWVTHALPNMRRALPVARRRRTSSAALEAPVTLTRAGIGEQCARTLQLLRLPIVLRKSLNHTDGVVVTDEILKFHVNDRRKEIAERFRERVKTVCRE